MDHETATAETAVEPAPTREVPGPSATPASPPTSSSVTVSTPEQAMRYDEAQRMRIFCAFAFILVSAVSLVTLVVPSDPTARTVFLAGLGVLVLAAAYFSWRLRDPANYRPSYLPVFGHLAILTVWTALYYWGPMSAALLVVPFGAFVFSMGRSFAASLSITIHASAAHAALSLLTTFGMLEDRGQFSMSEAPRAVQLTALVLVQSIIYATFIVARLVRRGTQAAVEQLDRTARALAQREALLGEFRQDLDRALQVGGAGFFTGQSVGPYQLGKVIGRGAMGEVYDARHRDTGEACAVKLLQPQALTNPGHFERFLREARAASSLKVPNVTRVLDVSEPDARLPYMAMERLEGHDLAYLLKHQPRLSFREVVDLVRQVGRALDAARVQGIVHRDLKPQNVFAHDGDGERVWKILDFGVSKLAAHEGTLTQGHVVGTPSYMAPEQAQSQDVDHRADIYSLAVIAYRCLTGRPAFSGGDIHQILFQVVYRMPPRPSHVADLPEEIDAVLAVGLAKERELRYDSASELAGALEAAGKRRLPPELRARANEVLERLPWPKLEPS